MHAKIPFETPILDCLMDKLDAFSTIWKCNGNEKHANDKFKKKRTLQIPQATVHSSEVADA
jgi:hypothetical protein